MEAMRLGLSSSSSQTATGRIALPCLTCLLSDDEQETSELNDDGADKQLYIDDTEPELSKAGALQNVTTSQWFIRELAPVTTLLSHRPAWESRTH